MMELGADRILLAFWLLSSPVTCQGITEAVFCTVTLRGRETGLKKGFLGSPIILVSLLEAVMLVISCMK